jgi:hypothetical protein
VTGQGESPLGVAAEEQVRGLFVEFEPVEASQAVSGRPAVGARPRQTAAGMAGRNGRNASSVRTSSSSMASAA